MPFSHTHVYTPGEVLTAAQLLASIDEAGTYADTVGAAANTFASAVATLAASAEVNKGKHGPNVERDFGAVGNGSTNDVVAFQNAINWLVANGGGVLDAPHQYLIGTPGIVLPQHCQQSITIAGVSPGAAATTSRPSRLVRNGAYPIIKTTSSRAALTGSVNAIINHAPNLVDLTLDGAGQIAPILDFDRVANTFTTRCMFVGSHGEAVKGQMLWNCHFTDCYFTGNGEFSTSTPGVRLTDSGAGTLTGTNTVHFTACEWEGNLHDDLRLEGANNGAVSILVNGCKFERSDGCAIRAKDSSAGIAVVGSMMYVEQDLVGNIFPAIIVNNANRVTIMGNVMGSGSPAPTYMIQLAAGAYATVLGNTFLTAGGIVHVRLDAGFGEAQVGFNSSDTFGSPTVVQDARTTKTGVIMGRNSLQMSGGLGVYGAQPPASRPVVSGIKSGGTALPSLIAALVSEGLISDTTT